jgi:HAD superfamily hydrolase (TIGR01544 family)
MSEFYFSNESHFQEVLGRMVADGKKHLHVVADFDRTLTKAFVEWKDTTSLITRLQNWFFPLEYAKKSQDIFDTYHPIEIDATIPMEQKIKAMQKWRELQFALMFSYGLTRDIIKQAMQSEETEFRSWHAEFFDLLYANHTPLLILSASGLWYESIYYCLEHENRLYDNIDIVSNAFIRDEEGNAIAARNPIIHSFNKWEIVIRDLPIYEDIKNRKNVILLWDGIGDAHMADGFDYKNIIRIGFLNHDTPENRKKFEEKFDLIILNDGPMDQINTLLKKIYAGL